MQQAKEVSRRKSCLHVPFNEGDDKVENMREGDAGKRGLEVRK
jgi:hypothetical protein